MNNLIVTDCDGCLLDCENGFHAWMARHGYERMPEVEQVSYSISPLYGLEAATAKQLVRQFNESAGIAFLEPLQNAIYVVRRLRIDYGFRFEVVTSLGDWEPSVELRKYNLTQVFGEGIFDEIFCLPIGEPKYDFLKTRYGQDSGAIWVEDHPDNATDGARLGMRTFLMKQDHNRQSELVGDITRVDSWDDIFFALK